jgi:hypothetical protein
MSSARFSLLPPAEPYSFIWSNGDTALAIVHSQLFAPCTQYLATIVEGLDSYTWTFFTVCPFLPGDNLGIRRM